MSVSRHAVGIGVAGLIASILGFAIALLLTLDEATRHFRRAELAQSQFALVLRIERLIAAHDRAAAADAILRYRRTIADETWLLPSSRRAEQGEEIMVASRLAALAVGRDTTDRAEIDRIVSATILREHREALGEAEAMVALRHRAWWLTGALMLAAIGSAALGGAGLFLSNRRLGREVARRTAEIAAIDASRRLFFAKASHELRTPVTVMRGEAEVALTVPGSEGAALEQVIAQADFLEHRIAELLALAQAEDGRLRLRFAPCDLRDVCTGARDAVAGFARANDVRLVVEADAAATTMADRRWLTQAVVAVLDNAVKFSFEGGTVRIAAHGGTISVGDSGIGMLPDAVPRIFDAFYQATDDPSRGGSGLGLALARWVIEQHDGTIAAMNGEEGGCVVTMTLPVQP